VKDFLFSFRNENDNKDTSIPSSSQRNERQDSSQTQSPSNKLQFLQEININTSQSSSRIISYGSQSEEQPNSRGTNSGQSDASLQVIEEDIHELQGTGTYDSQMDPNSNSQREEQRLLSFKGSEKLQELIRGAQHSPSEESPDQFDMPIDVVDSSRNLDFKEISKAWANQISGVNSAHSDKQAYSLPLQL